MTPRSPMVPPPLTRTDRLLRLAKVAFYLGACFGRPGLYFAWKDLGFRLLGRLGGYEHRAIRVLTGALPAGGWAVDVGGHFGVYTRAFLKKAGPQGGVVVIEPFPPAAERLQRTVGRAANCRVLPVAASERTGQSLLLRWPRLHGIVPEPALAWLDTEHVGSFPTGDQVEVKTLALDDLLPDLPRLDVVKIDTEGHELQVLAGAVQILTRRRPLVQFEERLTERLLGEYTSLAALLKYAVAKLESRGKLAELTEIPPDPGEFYLVPRERLP